MLYGPSTAVSEERELSLLWLEQRTNPELHHWVGLGWVGLTWVGLVWVGLSWIELG